MYQDRVTAGLICFNRLIYRDVSKVFISHMRASHEGAFFR